MRNFSKAPGIISLLLLLCFPQARAESRPVCATLLTSDPTMELSRQVQDAEVALYVLERDLKPPAEIERARSKLTLLESQMRVAANEMAFERRSILEEEQDGIFRRMLPEADTLRCGSGGSVVFDHRPSLSSIRSYNASPEARAQGRTLSLTCFCSEQLDRYVSRK